MLEVRAPEQRQQVVLILLETLGETEDVDETEQLVLLDTGFELEPADPVSIELEGEVLLSTGFAGVYGPLVPNDVVLEDGDHHGRELFPKPPQPALQFGDELIEQWIAVYVELGGADRLDQHREEVADLIDELALGRRSARSKVVELQLEIEQILAPARRLRSRGIRARLSSAPRRRISGARFARIEVEVGKTAQRAVIHHRFPRGRTCRSSGW